MSTLRWTQEQFDAHTAKAGSAALQSAIDKAPRRAQVAAPPSAQGKRQKYGNKPTTDQDGTKHASKKQAARYRDLGLLMKAGEIVMLAREVRFLLPGGIEYRADHVFANARALRVIAELIKDGDMTCEDVKSSATRQDKTYRIKAKQMENCLGIKVSEA